MSLVLSEAALTWLSDLFSKRLGAQVTLSDNGNTYLLDVFPEACTIEFDKRTTHLGCRADDISTSWWDPALEGLNLGSIRSLVLPGATEKPSPLLTFTSAHCLVSYDVPSLIFWMLTRLEEIKPSDLDVHQRFSSRHSHAYRHGYLDRPIIDEWFITLNNVLDRIALRRPADKKVFDICITHDVDRPSAYGNKGLKLLLKNSLKKLVVERSITKALTPFWVKLFSSTSLSRCDPFNTFDFLMSAAEARGLRCQFYFLSGSTNTVYDGDYRLSDSPIVSLMREIVVRGHGIGLHPSYDTFLSKKRLSREMQSLKTALCNLGLPSDSVGARMHYLRWQQPETLNILESVGASHDSTLGYSDSPGFRCGTCYAYKAFDPISDRPLNIVVRPLIVMDVCVTSPENMNLGFSDEALQVFLAYKRACQAVGGSYTILWHNSELETPEARAFYEHVLDG